MSRLQQAIDIAKRVHAGQFDKQGVEYFKHPETVASYVDGEDAKIVAYLHDVIEDGNGQVSLDDLRKIFGNEIANAVNILTRPKDMPYFDYIERIKTNDLAKKVKLADLKHNTDPSRGVIPSLIKRYEKAKEILAYDEVEITREL